MEKANIRASSSSSKTNISECKGKQDVPVKTYSRLPRCKESTSPHPEARRKPFPQKSKDVFDKRPRARSGFISERYRSEVVQAVDSVGCEAFGRKQGCKKVSLNHLLNFTLPPVENRDFIPGRSHTRFKHPKYNKEQFLQANCQFVTREGEDYAVHYGNPDVLVDWSFIEEVRLHSHEIPSCPICLYPPVAAKITRCGHIYCWPCILHYLALTDKTWQKCPICFDAVHKTDLKSVLPMMQRPVTVGNEIVMCLMKREKGSLFPVPVSNKSSLKAACSVNDDEGLICFQKLLLAKINDVFGIIQRERNELKQLLLQDEDAPEACFIESAMKLLNEREKNLCSSEKDPDSGVTQIAEHLQEGEHEDGSYPDDASENTSVSEFDTSVEDSILFSNDNPSLKTESTDTVENHDVNSIAGITETSDKQKGKDFYFYQAEDGQHVYLHNINIRMLVKEFGSLENCPPVIRGEAVELERISMNELLRKRLRYLQHLPLTCEFQLAELNFTPFLSKATLDEFSAEVQKRKHFRNKKARDERRREKHIQVEENKKLGKYPSATYNLNSVDQFPSYCSGGSQFSSPIPVAGENLVEEDSSWPFMAEAASSSSSLSSPDMASSPVTSFAQMLKDGQAKPQRYPLHEPKKVVPTVVCAQESDDEEHMLVPVPRQSFSDFLQIALETARNQKENPGEKNSKKKKKNKNKVLFTTSMCRNK